MVINHLSLKSFRNYKDFEIGFHPNINYIYGNNGQGKTNLIESLYFLTHLRSFRTNILKNLNQYSHKDSYIHAGLKKNETDHLIQIGIYQNFKKVLLDNKNIHFTSEFIKDFFSILFSPDLLASFKESPTDRRLFFDRVLLMTEPGYFNKYHEFNKIKKNKNELLKKGKKKELKVWNRLLAEVIPVITRDRKNIVLQINEFISQIFLELTGSQRNLMLVYSDDLEGKAVSEKDELIDFFDNKADHEIAKGFSFYGPHKDRYWMTLDGKLDKENFSQGEYRISFLALQFSINRVLKKKIDYQPVLLMDDLFSELDENVYQKTLNYIYENQNQVFITSTLKPNISSFYGQAFHINDGQLI